MGKFTGETGGHSIYCSDEKGLIQPEGDYYGALMSELPQEQPIIAAASIDALQRAFDTPRNYLEERTAFCKPITKLHAKSHTWAGHWPASASNS